jgi:predicted phage-related endonuclease
MDPKASNPPILQNQKRRGFIGGSDARIIMGTDEAALVRLWQEKRGETEPRDFSTNLIVQLGIVTEDLNRRWFELNSGHAVRDPQKRVRHSLIRWMAATLDGIVEGASEVSFETEHTIPLRSGPSATISKDLRLAS